MLRGIYGDPERYVKQYWSDVPGMYFTGDGARRGRQNRQFSDATPPTVWYLCRD